MKTILKIFSLSVFCVACSSNIPEIHKTGRPSEEEIAEYKGLKLSWSDEFNDDGLPAESIWGYEEGYMRNNEAQDYKVADIKYSHINDGSLILEAHSDVHEGENLWTGHPCFFDYSSASLTTKDKRTLSRGRIDIYAKIPTGKGIYPSIRLFSNDGDNLNAEIDIMEYVWNNDDMHPKIYSAISTQNDGKQNIGYGYSSSLEDKFHLYSVILDNDRVQVLFDRDVILTYNKSLGNADWPWGKSMYLSISLAVGGEFGASSWGIDESIFPKTMEIDFVRCYIPE
jgi:laminarinase, glycosyl hydrolase family 16 member